MKYLPLLFILLAGCSQNLPKPLVHNVIVTKIVIHKEKIPSQLLQVKPIPKVPKDISMQSDIAGYIIELYNSASSYKDSIDSIKKWNNRENK